MSERTVMGELWFEQSNASKTHCPSGHPLSGANLYRWRDGRRYCRTCHRDHERRRRERAKAMSSQNEGLGFDVPAGWSKMTEVERKLWIGNELLKTLRVMFDEAGLGIAFDFDKWVDRAPLPDHARIAIEMARRGR